MNRTLRRAGGPIVALLVALVLAVPSAAAPPAIPPAADYPTDPAPPAIPLAAAYTAADGPMALLTDDEKKKKIAEMEKEIAALQKKLEELKQAPTAQPEVTGTIPAGYVEKMRWRSIGPANMGGRVTELAVHPADPNTYYVATASGGLLKTTNNGTTFTHQFEKQSTVSIGAVAIAPSSPETVWIGTGECNPRNSVSRGDGVYKSENGGKDWVHMGLKESFQIGRIVIHPKDPNTVYVAAVGRLYGPNPDRGVFKTTDGGKTWTKVLYIDDKTGAIDLRMDPTDPNTLIAAMWERKRDEFDGFFGRMADWPSLDQYGPAVNTGPGGGLFKTTDGGKSWKKLTDPKRNNGLPTVKTGRIGIDYSAKTKGLLYAVIDTENLGMGRPVATVLIGLSTEEDKGGLKVTAAADDGPAAKAGIKEGDLVTTIDGKKMDSYDTFQELLASKKAGDVVKVILLRDKKEMTVEVKLAPKPGSEQPTGPVPTLGLQPQTAEGGIGIARVIPNGPAAAAGLQTDDVLTAIAGKKVTTNDEYRAVLAGFKPGDKVKLTVRRGKDTKEVEATLGQGGFGGGGQQPQTSMPNRPYLLSRDVGGQQPNVQMNQGKDGYQTGGVYVSKDGGETWTRVNSLNPRPFYFSQIRVDPTDGNIVYVLGDTSLYRSVDGGVKFTALGGRTRDVHPDFHDLWINPRNNKHMLVGCDGGFYVTYDQGAAWDHLNVLALGQFYHVAVDNRKPYRVYGGLQDNGSWGGPSQVLRGGGIVNEDWIFLRGGDGFVCRVDPSDPDLVYSESQNGVTGRRNLRTGESGSIRAQPVKPGEALRYNWNTPFILSNHNSSILYIGAQYLFRSVKKGDDLKAISPELTRTKQGTITAIAESPRTPEQLWVGTDDGFVWLSKDGGANWVNLTEKLKAGGLPGHRWVSSIEPSRVNPGRCYVCFDGHRSNDDRPHIYKTEDFGETWTPIAANLPSDEWSRVVREDYVNPELLYCGTEYGIWVSVNRGGSWTRLNNNLPTVAVHEVAQPTTASEIVIATHGRSVWVLDVASLRQMTPAALKAPATLFAPGPATRWKIETGREFPYSVDIRKFYGKNPEWGAGIDYVLTQPAKTVTLKVQDVTGTTVWEFQNVPKTPGFHRQNWGLMQSQQSGGGPRPGGGPGGGGFRRGGVVPAGEYRVVLAVDGKEFIQKVVVENDPNADPKAIITPGGGLERSYLDQERDEKKDEDNEGKDDEGEVTVPVIPRAKD